MNIKGILKAAKIKLEETKDIKKDEWQHRYMFAIEFFELMQRDIEENKEIKKDIFEIAEKEYKIYLPYLLKPYERKINEITTFAQIYGEEVDESKLNKFKQELNEEKIKCDADYEFVVSLFKDVYKCYLEPEEIIKELEKIGYKAYCIEKIDIIYETAGIANKADDYFSKGYDIVTNGTFYGGIKNTPYGFIINNGKYLNSSDAKAIKDIGKLDNRGGLTIGYDGAFKYDIVRYEYEKIQDKFITVGLDKFMGGGLLLIQNGKKITGKEIALKQRFNQEKFYNKAIKKYEIRDCDDGFKCEQMRNTYHLLIGECNGSHFIVAPKRKLEEFQDDVEKNRKIKDSGFNTKNGKQIQKDFSDIGFTSLIKYDGGGSFYWKSNDYFHDGGRCKNKTGWAIKVKKFK